MFSYVWCTVNYIQQMKYESLLAVKLSFLFMSMFKDSWSTLFRMDDVEHIYYMGF